MMSFDPEAHYQRVRLQRYKVRTTLTELIADFERLKKLREENPKLLEVIREKRGEVVAQRISDELGRDKDVARDVCERLSGTALGKALLEHGPKYLSKQYWSPPPEAA